jgi:hypothetical protein
MMELKNLSLDKKMKRKNFFFSLGAGIAGYLAFRSLPFKIFSKRMKPTVSEIRNSRIKINPLAVSRKNTGGNNV